MSENSTYKPTSHRFIAVLNKKYETGRLMNTLAHMTIAITNSHLDNLDDFAVRTHVDADGGLHPKIGRASCRERVLMPVYISVVAVSLKKFF